MVTSGRGKGRSAAVARLPASPADLFKLPLVDFTAARNALASRLKKAGKPVEAERVRSLNKPPLSAWTVNQLFWRHRPAFETLLKAGDRFRAAQAAQLAGRRGDLRGTLDARLAALSTLSTLAVDLLRGAGYPASTDLLRRVTTTLEALAAYGTESQGPRPGHLTADVDPPGFEALAALVPRAGGSAEPVDDPRVLPFPQKNRKKTRGDAKKTVGTGTDRARQQAEQRARRAEAKAAVRAAERTVRQAQRGAARAEAALKEAAATARDAEQARAELTARLEKATATATTARQSARRVAAAAEEAAQALADAERALDAARRQVAELE
jgi:hypothetical protein